MQDYLAIIQPMLLDWYTLTLTQPLYAAVIAMIVWLITALLYSIRLSSVKKKLLASEQADSEKQSQLDNAHQQILTLQASVAQTEDDLLQAQTALTDTRAQLASSQQNADQATQRAVTFEQHIVFRNQQLADILQSFATHFYFCQHPSFDLTDVNADSLWQQHEQMLVQLAQRLRTLQNKNLHYQQAYHAELLQQQQQASFNEPQAVGQRFV